MREVEKNKKLQNNKKWLIRYSTVHSTIPCAWCAFERKILHPSTTSGLSAWVNIYFEQRRQPLVPMLRWIIVLRLQQQCKEVRSDTSSQLEVSDAVWCKLVEYCSQMPNKRFTNAGLEAISESQLRRMQPVDTDDSHNRTHCSVHVRFFLFFSEKRQNVCVRTTRNIDTKNDGLRRDQKNRDSRALPHQNRAKANFFLLLLNSSYMYSTVRVSRSVTWSHKKPSLYGSLMYRSGPSLAEI